MKLKIIPIFIIALSFIFSFLMSPISTAMDMSVQGGANAAKGTDQPTDLFGDTGMFTKISNILLFIVGAIAVIMIVIGGLRYVTSGGDSANVSAAKNTILYALVGVIIAILAYSIINFVIGSFTGAGSGGMTNV